MNAVQLKRCKDLLRIGETLLVPPLTYTLGFDEVDCGTYACLVGHYQRHREIPAIQALDLYASDFWNELEIYAEYFGITRRQAHWLFGLALAAVEANQPGDAAYAELEKRLALLRGIIATAEAEPLGLVAAGKELGNDDVQQAA